jgi:hypothetical protein
MSTQNKPNVTINKVELLQLLMNIESSTFVNLVTETKVRMNKTNNPYFDKVIKRNKCTYLVGNDYEKRVNSNEVKEGLEGDFKSEEMKGKKHISKCVCVDTKTESVHYLMVERFDEVKPQKTEYICEGSPIEKQLFETYMTKVYESNKQEQERKVMVITPKLDSIKEITLNGTHYIIEG